MRFLKKNILFVLLLLGVSVWFFRDRLTGLLSGSGSGKLENKIKSMPAPAPSPAVTQTLFKPSVVSRHTAHRPAPLAREAGLFTPNVKPDFRLIEQLAANARAEGEHERKIMMS